MKVCGPVPTVRMCLMACSLLGFEMHVQVSRRPNASDGRRSAGLLDVPCAGACTKVDAGYLLLAILNT